MKRAKEVKDFLSRLDIGHVQVLLNRYELDPKNTIAKKARQIMTTPIAHHIKTNGLGECPICFEPTHYNTAVITPCTHIFCDICLLHHLHKNYKCPMCRTPIEYLDIMSQIAHPRIMEIMHTIPVKVEVEAEVEEEIREQPTHQVFAGFSEQWFNAPRRIQEPRISDEMIRIFYVTCGVFAAYKILYALACIFGL